MPRRICICTGCPACTGKPHTYDKTTSPGKQRCRPCQQKADARPNTTARGYGSQHQQLRAQLLDAFVPVQPCWRCGRPIARKADAQLGHDDNNRTRYRGLEHTKCNEGAPNKRR